MDVYGDIIFAIDFVLGYSGLPVSSIFVLAQRYSQPSLNIALSFNGLLTRVAIGYDPTGALDASVEHLLSLIEVSDAGHTDNMVALQDDELAVGLLPASATSHALLDCGGHGIH